MKLKVEKLCKSYGQQKALSDVSFSLEGGEIVGLLGPNGAGKTTTMRILAGCHEDYDGNVILNGQSIRDQGVSLKNDIGYLPEHNPLYLEMYVREFLQWSARSYGLVNPKEKVQKVIERVGLNNEKQKKIKALSKGYKQRVGLAQAIIHDPNLLILDEPVSGLDPNQLLEIRQLIKELGVDKTVIFSSHILQEIEAICDRVIVLSKGKKVADDSLSTLKQIQKAQICITLELEKDAPLKAEHITGYLKLQKLGFAKFAYWFRTGTDPRAELFDAAVSANNRILGMQKKQFAMEEVFAQLTQN